MNKTALGFFVGIAIVVAGAVGYFAATKMQQPDTAAAPATPAAATPSAAIAALAEKAKSPVTPLAEAAKAEAPPAVTPATEAAINTAKAMPAATDTVVKMARVASSATYAPGGTVDLALNLEVSGTDVVRALGIEETLPDGFAFDGIVGDSKPDLVPEVGKTGKVEFVWIQVPKLPTTLAYRIKAADGTTGVKEITGQTLMRGSGPEVRSEVVKTALDSGAPGSTPAPAPAPAPSPTPEPAPAVEAAPAAPLTSPDAAAMDEQKKKLEEMAAKLKQADEEKKNAPPVEVARSISAGGYTPGQPLEISVTLNYAAADPVTALALVETLPEGWSFDKVTGGAAPAVSPPAGKTGPVTFIWVQIPTFPATLTYTVNVPATDSGARTLSGKAAYRTTGAQIEGPPTATDISNK